MLPIFILASMFVFLQNGTSIQSKDLLKESHKLALKEKLCEATETLYRGLENLGNNPYADTLFKEIWDILSVEDLIAYPKTEDKGFFLLRFWQKQDPTPATLENERYIEHMNRLEYARRRYSSPQPRGYDDRGMIFVRYGMPDNSVEIPSHQILKPNECWAYYDFGSLIAFDFYQKGAMYTLATDLREIAEIDKAFGSRSKLAIIRSFAEPRRDMTLGYAELAMAAASRGGINPIDCLKKVSDKNRYDRNKLPHSVTRFTKPEQPLPCTISLCRFFRKDRSRLETYYAVPWNELDPEETPNGCESEITLNYAIRNYAFNILSHKAQNKKILLSTGVSMKDQIHVSQINEYLEPGIYFFSIEIKNSKANKAIEKTYKVVIPEVTDRLLISDIQLTSDIQPKENHTYNLSFVKNNLYIIPHPFSTISQKRPIFIYFEVNNLVFNDLGSTAYTVEYEVKEKKRGLRALNPFARKKLSLSSSYQRNTQNRNEPEYFSLDVSKLSPGDYTLKIKVTDDIVGTSRTSEINLEVVE